MEHPDADVRDLKSLKEFMKDVAMGIQGEEADPDLDMDSELEEHAAEETVIQYWKDFTRAYYRENNPFDKEITNSVRKVCSPWSGPLPNVTQTTRLTR